ncbi:hypothetical protein LIER_38165 [Lithospermum erythrorhizon]|uniref:GAG-pre-integrase domain-containing protein n=1 Tax=Lithospermum erythrorhizon TaxID=34254 RepID=A0AAV3Q066_LITER
MTGNLFLLQFVVPYIGSQQVMDPKVAPLIQCSSNRSLYPLISSSKASVSASFSFSLFESSRPIQSWSQSACATQPVQPAVAPVQPPSSTISVSYSVWHNRLGHPGSDVLHDLVRIHKLSCSLGSRTPYVMFVNSESNLNYLFLSLLILFPLLLL